MIVVSRMHDDDVTIFLLLGPTPFGHPSYLVYLTRYITILITIILTYDQSNHIHRQQHHI